MLCTQEDVGNEYWNLNEIDENIKKRNKNVEMQKQSKSSRSRTNHRNRRKTEKIVSTLFEQQEKARDERLKEQTAKQSRTDNSRKERERNPEFVFVFYLN